MSKRNRDKRANKEKELFRDWVFMLQSMNNEVPAWQDGTLKDEESRLCIRDGSLYIKRDDGSEVVYTHEKLEKMRIMLAKRRNLTGQHN